MAEYIDREMLIADLEKEIEYESGMYTKEQNDFLKKGLRIALKDVKYMQSEDVVPVIRCKDCKHWNNGDCYRIELTRPNDFCSYGERKENEGT